MFTDKKKYPATILDCGVATDQKSGLAQPYVKFEIKNEAGATAPYTWYGSLVSEKSTEFAVKTLVKMGFTGGDFTDLNKGITIFTPGLKLNIELEYGQKADGTKSDKLRIKWVNASSGTLEKFKGTLPSQVGLFSRIKAELGVKKITTPTATASKPVPSDW
jgi:hypothetical protein